MEEYAGGRADVHTYATIARTTCGVYARKVLDHTRTNWQAPRTIAQMMILKDSSKQITRTLTNGMIKEIEKEAEL